LVTSRIRRPNNSTAATPQSAPAAYIVVIGTIPTKGPAGLKAAARAVVAARNAGLKDVVANKALPGAKGTFTDHLGLQLG